MLSAIDLERLIAVKRLDIEKEKTFLGLASPDNRAEDDQHRVHAENPKRSVNFQQKRDLCAYNVPSSEEKKERDGDTGHEEEIPSDLERYIRRYLGLPVMLKAGEYSPNNPLVRGERTTGDVLLGLGEYERRRNTLRRLRQQQYREYLDQQAKKKQEAKEQAEKERREREERNREREEREREREREEREREQQERERERERWREERRSPERRRASANTVSCGALSYNKVDTGVQVDCKTAPLSVAVQTDDADLFRLPQSPSKSQLTQAERELSPHTVVDAAERPPPWTLHQDKWKPDKQERRRSYGDFDERSSTLVRKSNRDKLTSDLRHSYMPSIFDADAIEMRNMQAEKEAAARRQFYQQELKNQIMEQQRIREERKTREKMLEAAEMRRLEEQLRMLRTAQDAEVHRHKDLDLVIKEDNKEYDKKRKELQKDIDNEQIKLIRAPLTTQPLKRLPTSRSDAGKLPYYYPLLQERNKDPPLLQERSVESAYFKERPIESTLFKEKTRENSILQDRPKDKERKPFSTNIPDDSIFSPNYDVDGYLRRNLNFKAFEYNNKDLDLESIGTKEERNVEKVQIHDLPKVKPLDRVKPIPKERKCLPQESMDSLPIPVLRHSPVTQLDRVESGSDLSDAMKKVDDKWKVPAVQKNILKSIPNDEGKNVSILTQLGSIRRQLQLEQLKLDRLTKDDEIGTDIK